MLDALTAHADTKGEIHSESADANLYVIANSHDRSIDDDDEDNNALDVELTASIAAVVTEWGQLISRSKADVVDGITRTYHRI